MTEVARTTVVRTRAALARGPGRRARPVGLVPTMGWLHEGHRALMRRARADNATVVVTIFVNPRQFNVASDYSRYPRNEARDLAMCEAEGVDLVFAPEVEEIYPPGFATTVSVGAVALPLEGAARPGHFDGVATVVAILFDLVGAERAYFGQKDAQQVMVIRQMARDLAIGTEVVDLPDDPGAGRARAVVTQRPPHPGGARRGAGPAAGAGRGARGVAGGRARRPNGCATRCSRSWPTEPLADVEYVSVADAMTLRGADRGRRSGARVARGALRDDPPHRQRDPRPAGGNHRRLSGVGGGGRRGSRPRPAPAPPRPLTAPSRSRARPDS